MQTLATAAGEGIARTNPRVLVVDDDPSIRALIGRQLLRIGVDVVETALDGADAMRTVAASPAPFEVVICDLRMPNEDGLVLLRRLSGLHSPPAVILTSGEDPVFLDAARRIGLSHRLPILGTLAKPHTADQLATLLHAVKPPPQTPIDRSHAGPLQAAEIEHALASGLVEVWFQPQLEVATGRIVGAEALLRVRHRRRGIVLPGSFIGPAEKHGLLPALTEFVLRRSVGWCRDWRERGFPLSVSINVSAATMRDVTYPDFAASLCAAEGVCPTQVVFELTESSLSHEPTVLLDIVTRMRLKGFGVSIDDFGTGYSSLDQLRTLPFSELKVDHVLVRDAVENPKSRKILDNSLALATQLGMSTVAEGVESTEILDLVTKLGCQLAQGFLIAEPMPAPEVAAWLAEAPIPAVEHS